jgi:hypothetical protein
MFSTPRSKEWSNVTLKQKIHNGTTKAAECNSCGTALAGNAGRMRVHMIKCEACPTDLREWARAKEAAGEKRREHNHITKKLELRIEEDEDNDLQQTITGIFRGAANAKAICDDAMCAWVCGTLGKSADTEKSDFVNRRVYCQSQLSRRQCDVHSSRALSRRHNLR